MCGRFTQTADWGQFQRELPFRLPPDAPATLQPRYNIAPTQDVWTVARARDGAFEARRMRWGLIPAWMQTRERPAGFINARLETLAAKPAFRRAVQQGRCLVLADGYYEWAASGGAKQPYRIVRADHGPLWLGGVGERFTGADGRDFWTMAIVTRAAAPEVAALHPRMPVVLDAQSAWRWLTAEWPDWPAVEEAAAAAPRLTAYPVSRRVNRPDVDDPALIEAVG
jgi:putative SOS response-associated peptidase YedK